MTSYGRLADQTQKKTLFPGSLSYPSLTQKSGFNNCGLGVYLTVNKQKTMPSKRNVCMQVIREIVIGEWSHNNFGLALDKLVKYF